jgi:hypothetical protein
VPSQEGLRLDDREDPSPLDESGEDAQRETRGVVETARFDPTFDVERQLLAEEETRRPGACVSACRARATEGDHRAE